MPGRGGRTLLRRRPTQESRAARSRSAALQAAPALRYMSEMDQIATLATPPFALSAQAAARIGEIVGMQPGGPSLLRVAVLAGGCSGFQYRFELADAADAEDAIIERDGARVVVDPASLDLLAGAELHFSDALMGAHFTVRNPNATSSCGCGTSFSID